MEIDLLHHELKTPINQILGYASLVQEELRGLVDEAPIEDLERIKSAARKLLVLVQTIDAPPGSISPLGLGQRSPSGFYRLDLPSPPEPPAGRESKELGALLVVDDKEMNRDILSRCLRSQGYEVAVAGDGAQALEQIAARPFDAVLLDVMMPGMSGLEVLREIRKTISMAELPVIMATARDHSDDVVEGLRLGANDYVSKPLDLEVVLARLQIHLSLKRSREKVQSLADELELRNHFIQKTFGRYLSDDVVSSLLETPEGLRIGGEKRRVTLLMSDLRGFTSMTEGMPPEQVVQILNNYLGAMAEIITRYGGTIDEFIGDAIFAVFGAPFQADDDALRAAACALEMQLGIGAVNARNAAEGLPELQMGIALHTGDVVVGNIGSEARAKYGVVGSHVNLVARIESFTVGGQILISESARRLLGPDLRIGRTSAIEAKGFKDRITVHDLVGLGPPYDLCLPEHKDEQVCLHREVPVQFWWLLDKHVNGDALRGGIVSLSLSGAEICAQAPPPPFANLRLRFAGARGEGAAADLYAKVIDGGDAERGRFRVRFTSFPPEAMALVRETISAKSAPAAPE